MIKWKKREAEELAPELIEKYQLSPITAKLFSLRGINTDEKLAFWFDATEDDLADPLLMHDMAKALDRINRAIDAGEKITIYGDYDADGITATTIMTETLGILGADVHYFIPNRFTDGYGPNLNCYKRIVADGTKLIITVDNGITGIEEVAYAKSKGVDTIITDHHTIQEREPAACAIVHCNYPGQKYPFDDYCGAGVAYTICRGLMQDTMPELLELAMIGTIGDMVKVSGEGHIVVKRGLAMLNQTQRPGLRALIEAAGLTLGKINETDIGFNIAPRLNAVGRLADANMAVRLLLSDDEAEVTELAQKVEKLNDERKALTTQVYNDCLTLISNNGWQNRQTLVIYQPDFHEGVLGLVANKIVEKLHKPTIVLTKNDTGEIKGSGRSIPGFNLFDALVPLKGKLLTKFGGHDFACGLSLTEANINALRTEFEHSFKPAKDLQVKYYDMELPLQDAQPDTFAEMMKVGPFGTDNEQPLFSITQPQISNFMLMGKDKSHVRFNVAKAGGKLQVVGFNKAYLTNNLLPFVNQLFVQLSLNHFRNKVTLQGIIEDITFAAPKMVAPAPIVDLRQEKYVMGFADRYLLFDEKNISAAEANYGLSTDQLELVSDYSGQNEVAVLLDVPHNPIELDKALENSYQQLYLRFLLDQLPVSKIPDKSAFGKVLKYVYKHPTLKPADYRMVAPYLSLDYDSVLFILRVFFELGFVQLKHEKLVGVQHPVKKPLTASNYLKSVRSQLAFATKLRNMPREELLDYISSKIN